MLSMILLFFLWFLPFLFCHCSYQKESMQFSPLPYFLPQISHLPSLLTFKHPLPSVYLPTRLSPPPPSTWEGFSQQLDFLLFNPKRFSKVNQYLRSLSNWINLLWLLCCHWGSSSSPSNGQSFLSLTSLLLAFIIELSKYCIRTWLHFTSYYVKTVFPCLQRLPKSFINFSG